MACRVPLLLALPALAALAFLPGAQAAITFEGQDAASLAAGGTLQGTFGVAFTPLPARLTTDALVADTDGDGLLSARDVWLSGPEPGRVVVASEEGVGSALAATALKSFAFDDVDDDGVPDLNEPVYACSCSSVVQAGDVRIVPSAGFAAGSAVAAGNPDAGVPILAFPGTERFFDTNSNGLFDAGDALYVAKSASVTANDVRLTAFAGRTAGTSVRVSDADLGVPTNAFAGATRLRHADPAQHCVQPAGAPAGVTVGVAPPCGTSPFTLTATVQATAAAAPGNATLQLRELAGSTPVSNFTWVVPVTAAKTLQSGTATATTSASASSSGGTGDGFDAWHPFDKDLLPGLVPSGDGFSTTAAAAGGVGGLALAGVALKARDAAQAKPDDRKKGQRKGRCDLLHALKEDATEPKEAAEASVQGAFRPAGPGTPPGAPTRRLRQGPGWVALELDGPAPGEPLEHALAEPVAFERSLVQVWGSGGCTHAFAADGGYALAGGLVAEGLRGTLETEVEAELEAEAETDGDGALTNMLDRHLKAGPVRRTWTGDGKPLAVGVWDLLGLPSDGPLDPAAFGPAAQEALRHLAAALPGVPAGSLRSADEGGGRFRASATVRTTVLRLRLRVTLHGQASRVRLAALAAQPLGTLKDEDCPVVPAYKPAMKHAGKARRGLGKLLGLKAVRAQRARLRQAFLAEAKERGLPMPPQAAASLGAGAQRLGGPALLAVLPALGLAGGMLVDRLQDLPGRWASAGIGGALALGLAALVRRARS